MPFAPPRSVLVTGAAGFIGSTLVRRLLADGCLVVGLDSLERGHAEALPTTVPLIRGDVRDAEAVREAMRVFGRPPEACIHLAGLILVGESMVQPQRYHAVNAGGTQVVTEACLELGVPTLVLASSAAVLSARQGDAQVLDEDARLGPASPYGASKLAAERTVHAATQTGHLSGVALRLFNVAGAAYDCKERHDPETHLIPLALLAAMGREPPLRVFGTHLPTEDGTCLRDYVHIVDTLEVIVRATARAIRQHAQGEAGWDVFHVGTGRATSVLRVLATVAKVLGREVPTAANPPRLGDVPVLVSDPSKVRGVLGVRPDADLERMVRDAARALDLL